MAQLVHSVELLRALEEDHGRHTFRIEWLFAIRVIFISGAFPGVHGDVTLDDHSFTLGGVYHPLNLRHGLDTVRAPGLISGGHNTAKENHDELFSSRHLLVESLPESGSAVVLLVHGVCVVGKVHSMVIHWWIMAWKVANHVKRDPFRAQWNAIFIHIFHT